MEQTTPQSLGYRFPAEWEPHTATWLSWPHKAASWPGKLDAIYPVYSEFVRLLAEQETVCIHVADAAMEAAATQQLQQAGADLTRIRCYHFPTDDAWCRDHGPAFVVRQGAEAPLALVDWGYNAWGGKYPPFAQDNAIPGRIATALDIPRFQPGIVMEGGSIEVNGAGTLLTSKACLLNPNRNPHLSQTEIETYLRRYYGQDQILWLEDGIIGDDTDGHIDDITRFVSPTRVLTAVEPNRQDPNHAILAHNLDLLRAFRLADGSALELIALPMPAPVWYDGQRLPASYANFYIANGLVVVPTYRCAQDHEALAILQDVFPDRNVVGLDSTDIIWGLGSFHCLSQQQPSIP